MPARYRVRDRQALVTRRPVENRWIIRPATRLVTIWTTSASSTEWTTVCDNRSVGDDGREGAPHVPDSPPAAVRPVRARFHRRPLPAVRGVARRGAGLSASARVLAAHLL